MTDRPRPYAPTAGARAPTERYGGCRTARATMTEACGLRAGSALMHRPDPHEKTILVPRGMRAGAVPHVPAPASLVLIDGPADSLGRQWLLEDGEAIIGRAMTSHVFVDDPSVSRAHTRLSVVRDGILITDLQSSNRT